MKNGSRAENKKLAYQIANKSFKIEISKDVFHPSDWANRMMNVLKISKGIKIIDIGTGTGVIGIYAALLGGKVFATDISHKAIEQTKRNAKLNGVSINYSVGNFFSNHKTLFDVITVNLPQEIVPEDYVIKKELLSTLKGGKKGNEIILEFFKQAPKYMHMDSKIIAPICSLSYYLERLNI